jgi:hypothetical protein
VTSKPATKKAVVEVDSSRHAPLAMDAATFRTLGHRLVDQVAGLLESFVSNAVVGGRYVLRACIVNFHTAQAEMGFISVAL